MTAETVDDGLTAEERAALQEPDDTTTLADPGEGETNGQEEAKTEAAGNPAADGQAAETAAAAEAAAAAPAAAPAADDGPQKAGAQPAPLLVATLPEGAESRLTEIGTQKDALLEQFDSGDLTAREYQKQLDALNKEERALEYQINEARLAEKLNTQRLQNEWQDTCNRFVEANSVYKEMPWLYMQLDAKVRELASKPETTNWSGQKFLDEAHKEIVAKYKLPTLPSTPQPNNKRQQVDLPPNLAKVPAADVQDTNGGEFAVLDRLANTDPIAYEETLAKMPAAKREAYLASS